MDMEAADSSLGVMWGCAHGSVGHSMSGREEGEGKAGGIALTTAQAGTPKEALARSSCLHIEDS